jgi:hypothetical protein
MKNFIDAIDAIDATVSFFCDSNPEKTQTKKVYIKYCLV